MSAVNNLLYYIVSSCDDTDLRRFVTLIERMGRDTVNLYLRRCRIAGLEEEIMGAVNLECVDYATRVRWAHLYGDTPERVRELLDGVPAGPAAMHYINFCPDPGTARTAVWDAIFDGVSSAAEAHNLYGSVAGLARDRTSTARHAGLVRAAARLVAEHESGERSHRSTEDMTLLEWYCDDIELLDRELRARDFEGFGPGAHDGARLDRVAEVFITEILPATTDADDLYARLDVLEGLCELTPWIRWAQRSAINTVLRTIAVTVPDGGDEALVALSRLEKWLTEATRILGCADVADLLDLCASSTPPTVTDITSSNIRSSAMMAAVWVLAQNPAVTNMTPVHSAYSSSAYRGYVTRTEQPAAVVALAAQHWASKGTRSPMWDTAEDRTAAIVAWLCLPGTPSLFYQKLEELLVAHELTPDVIRATPLSVFCENSVDLVGGRVAETIGDVLVEELDLTNLEVALELGGAVNVSELNALIDTI